MKKRILIALFAGATVFGVALAFAASLGLTSGNLQAGDSAVASCDTDGVAATYTVGYSGGYNVSGVSVTGINPACDGRKVGVTLTGTGGTVLATGEVTYNSSGGSVTQISVPVTGVTVASVLDVHAVIYS